jgi:hypothetical protein
VEFMASIPPLPVCTSKSCLAPSSSLCSASKAPPAVSSAAAARIRKVEQHFETLTEVEGQEGNVGPVWERHTTKRRKLFIAAMRTRARSSSTPTSLGLTLF